MKKRLVFLALTLMLIMGYSQAAFAAGTGWNNVGNNRNSCRDAKWVPLAERLNLSDRQVQQVKEINLNTYNSTKALKIKLLDLKFERRQLMIEGKDRAAIDAKCKEINKVRTEIQKLQQQKWQKINSVLSSEQQAKLKEMKDFGKHGGHCKGFCP